MSSTEANDPGFCVTEILIVFALSAILFSAALLSFHNIEIDPNLSELEEWLNAVRFSGVNNQEIVEIVFTPGQTHLIANYEKRNRDAPYNLPAGVRITEARFGAIDSRHQILRHYPNQTSSPGRARFVNRNGNECTLTQPLRAETRIECE